MNLSLQNQEKEGKFCGRLEVGLGLGEEVGSKENSDNGRGRGWACLGWS